jgi:hypothetical protein
VYEIKGELGEAIVVDGGWIEKLRSGQSVSRVPASRFQGLEVSRYSKRRFVAFGEKSEHLSLTINAGTFIGLQLPADREADAERLRGELERAKAEAAD